MKHRTFEIVGTINEGTPVFGTTYGRFSQIAGASFIEGLGVPVDEKNTKEEDDSSTAERKEHGPK